MKRWVRSTIRLSAVAMVTAAGALVAASAAPAALPGLFYVTVNSQHNSTVYKSVTAHCPAGLRVIGMAFELNGAGGHVVLDDLIPNETSVTVGAGEIVGPGEPSDGTTLSWQVSGTAVCAVAPPGLEIVTAVTNQPAGSHGTDITATCPGAKRLLGAGAALGFGFGQISMSRLRILENSARAFAVDDEDNFSGSWSLTAYAICADPNPDLRLVVAGTGLHSFTSNGVSTFCPLGRRAITVGWDVNTEGQVLSTGAFIAMDRTTIRTTAHEDSNGYNGAWDLWVTGVCATP